MIEKVGWKAVSIIKVFMMHILSDASNYMGLEKVVNLINYYRMGWDVENRNYWWRSRGTQQHWKGLKKGYEVTFIWKRVHRRWYSFSGGVLFDSFGLLSKPPWTWRPESMKLFSKIKGEYRRVMKNFERLWMVDRKKWQQV